MAQDASVKVESIEALTKEANELKTKLEDERQKLNDVTCKLFASNTSCRNKPSSLKYTYYLGLLSYNYNPS